MPASTSKPRDGKCNIPPTSLKSDRPAKSAAPGRKRLRRAPKHSPQHHFQLPRHHREAAPARKIRPQTSRASHRRRFSRSPGPFRASPRAPANHATRLKSATALITLACRSIHVDDATQANHAPPLLSDDAANPRAGPAHRADDSTRDFGPRSLHAATSATEIHRARLENLRASFTDHPHHF